jgi:predicted transcriptional regulator
MQTARKLWWTRQELRRELINLLNSANHPCSLWVIEHSLNLPQPSLLTQIRLERALRGLIQSGIVERVTVRHVDGREFYLYQIAQNISMSSSADSSPITGEPS